MICRRSVGDASDVLAYVCCAKNGSAWQRGQTEHHWGFHRRPSDVHIQGANSEQNIAGAAVLVQQYK